MKCYTIGHKKINPKKNSENFGKYQKSRKPSNTIKKSKNKSNKTSKKSSKKV